MKTLKFQATFKEHNNYHDQDEYTVTCIAFNGAFGKPDMQPFTVAAYDNNSKFAKIADTLSNVGTVEYHVAKITTEVGRKNFEKAFWDAFKKAFKEKSYFEFNVYQSGSDSCKFTTDITHPEDAMQSIQKKVWNEKYQEYDIETIFSKRGGYLEESDQNKKLEKIYREIWSRDDFGIVTLYTLKDKKPVKAYIQLTNLGYDVRPFIDGTMIPRFFASGCESIKSILNKI